MDPLKITAEFNNILANPVIATRVVSKVVLHTDLYVYYDHRCNQHHNLLKPLLRYIRLQGSVVKESVHKFEMGSVTADTELTFEYGVKKNAIKKKGNHRIIW